MQEKRELIRRIDQLIRMKVSGTAQELANRLEISRSTFFRVLEDMKENLNAPIVYNSTLNRYEYEQEGQIHIGFFTNLDENDLMRIEGGSNIMLPLINKNMAISYFETVTTYTCDNFSY